MKRRLCIDLNDLPPRPTPLSLDSLAQVFGGCSTTLCSAALGGCCPGYRCTIFVCGP
jgi:hypothetical protein